ncbi:GntR family transcriptional regulator [Aliiruegeria haliotis]|uniref:GntR family transcriptional regulator n=1 Tax=Aliiruegeria haliotis TaxID=1280846 RepID=A0A2T0RG32_9RHOB|nr:FCD domain-containing protein [Aliiruegeria haliotis]PRY20081.1 GntR family transcriptional regulator [Aliiruegeria haliotis]
MPIDPVTTDTVQNGPLRPSRVLAERIETEILPHVAVGERLPTERDLSDKFGVGRTIVREALLVLELSDLIVTRKGSGSIKLKSKAHTSAATPLAEPEIGPFELIQARLTIEGAVAALAANVATATDLRRMKTSLEEHTSILQGPLTDETFHKVMDVDSRFHLEIAESTHNLALIRSVDFVRRYVGKTREWEVFLEIYERDRDQLELALEEHRTILEKLMARDAPGAQTAMRAHIFRKWGGLRGELEARGMPLDTRLFEITVEI